MPTFVILSEANEVSAVEGSKGERDSVAIRPFDFGAGAPSLRVTARFVILSAVEGSESEWVPVACAQNAVVFANGYASLFPVRRFAKVQVRRAKII